MSFASVSAASRVSVSRIEAAIELLEDAADRGALVLAARISEEIAHDAPANVQALAEARPGAAGLGVWMLLLARVSAVSSALLQRGDVALAARYQRVSVALLAAPMKLLRVSLREVRE